MEPPDARLLFDSHVNVVGMNRSSLQKICRRVALVFVKEEQQEHICSAGGGDGAVYIVLFDDTTTTRPHMHKERISILYMCLTPTKPIMERSIIICIDKQTCLNCQVNINS